LAPALLDPPLEAPARLPPAPALAISTTLRSPTPEMDWQASPKRTAAPSDAKRESQPLPIETLSVQAEQIFRTLSCVSVRGPMVLGAGSQIGQNVRLKRLLGQGGMGSVWVGEHLTLHTDVAVKFMAVEIAQDGAAVARFS